MLLLSIFLKGFVQFPKNTSTMFFELSSTMKVIFSILSHMFPLLMVFITRRSSICIYFRAKQRFLYWRQKNVHFFLFFVLNYCKTAAKSINILVSKIYVIADLKRIPLWLSWEHFALRDSSFPCFSVLLPHQIISPQYFAIMQKYTHSTWEELRIRTWWLETKMQTRLTDITKQLLK